MGSRLLSVPVTADERPYVMALGRRLKAVREDAGWTRAQLADATGLNRKTIWRIEVGARRARVRTLAVALPLPSPRKPMLSGRSSFFEKGQLSGDHPVGRSRDERG